MKMHDIMKPAMSTQTYSNLHFLPASKTHTHNLLNAFEQVKTFVPMHIPFAEREPILISEQGIMIARLAIAYSCMERAFFIFACFAFVTLHNSSISIVRADFYGAWVFCGKMKLFIRHVSPLSIERNNNNYFLHWNLWFVSVDSAAILPSYNQTDNIKTGETILHRTTDGNWLAEMVKWKLEANRSIER